MSYEFDILSGILRFNPVVDLSLIHIYVLDAFFPKILTLIICFIVYYLVKEKKWSATKIMLWMIPVAIIGYLTTILA